VINKVTGVALITSLLLLSVVTLLVMAMTTRQQLDLQRSTHLSHAEQGHWYALSAENWAMGVINGDGQNIDSRHDDWAISVPPIAIEQGIVAVSIIDLQGRFNLNNLLQAGKPHPPSIARLNRIMAELNIDQSILPALIDWLDADTIETPGGAEDRFYATLQPPYRAANRLMTDPSELRLVRGVNKKNYAQLQPYITVLPMVTGINVNTASPLVLSALADNTEIDVDAVIFDREQMAFKKVESFQTYFHLPGDEPAVDGLVVASSYFLMTTDVSLGVSRHRRKTLLFRNQQTTVSLGRAPGYNQ